MHEELKASYSRSLRPHILVTSGRIHSADVIALLTEWLGPVPLQKCETLSY
jgi:hypothetical protein